MGEEITKKEEITKIIRSKNKKKDTMIAKITEAIIAISSEYNLGYEKAQVDQLAERFLFNEKYTKFVFKNKDGYYIYPTVRLEVWLLEKEYLDESS